MSKGQRLAVGVAVVALVLLAAPARASAQFFPIAEEAGPGITISGTGLARVEAPARLSEVSIQRAVDSAATSASRGAVRDARRRAEGMAGAAGVELGALTEVALDDAFPQFGPPRNHCRPPRGGSRQRCRVPVFAASQATLTFSIVGGSESSEAGVTVEAYGSASIPVKPRDRRNNRSIRQAVLEARRAALPAAAAAARRNVGTAARSAGLELGRIVSLSEEQPFYPYDVSLGSFGPGRFCGVVRRPVFRRDPDTGRFRVVGRTRRRRCNVPRAVTLRLETVYEAR
jgi:uncharacterized protein YggE